MADEALERHRMRYRMNGFPIYDDESDEPPQRLRIPRPAEPTALMMREDEALMPTIDVDEYEWDPHARRYIASR